MENTYKTRTILYTMMWVNGHPHHNRIDGECCPDFSCCEPELFTSDPDERQKMFLNLIKRI